MFRCSPLTPHLPSGLPLLWEARVFVHSTDFFFKPDSTRVAIVLSDGLDTIRRFEFTSDTFYDIPLTQEWMESQRLARFFASTPSPLPWLYSCQHTSRRMKSLRPTACPPEEWVRGRVSGIDTITVLSLRDFQTYRHSHHNSEYL